MTPAMRAPILIDRPAAWAATPAPTTISRHRATNSSWPDWVRLRLRATERNRGRRTRRPITTTSARPMAAGASANRVRPISWGSSTPPGTAAATSRETVIRMGATARSWASRTAKVERPATDFSLPCSAMTGMTTAVEDRARPMPSTAAPANDWPIRVNRPPRTTAQTTTCIRPKPKTSLRIALSRSHDSSRPIMNNRKATPSSLSWAIWVGSLMVNQLSQGVASANCPRP